MLQSKMGRSEKKDNCNFESMIEIEEKVKFIQAEGLQIKWLQGPDLFSVYDGQDVVRGLMETPKFLFPKYFYDERGSELFEQICELPEYYLTRTETSILQRYAGEIVQQIGPCELVELGSGSSTKTRLLLDAYQALDISLRYVPIDVSGKILEASARQLQQDYSPLQIHGLVGTYEQALAQLKSNYWPVRTICFLGSTLGNFTQKECDRFFTDVTAALKPGDYFLAGIDLQKDQDIMEMAYNDREGVSAALNLNMLSHLNWRFGGNFDLGEFEHQAIYNRDEDQIELYLQCQKHCNVYLDKLDLTVEFQAGETVLTQISRKFKVEKIQQYLQTRGLKLVQTWTDTREWFAVLLCQMHG